MRTVVVNAEDLYARDEALDAEVCGFALADPGKTKIVGKGAHDPTPTPYFILEELFEHFEFSPESHLLDVGCGLGRVLAFFKRQGFEGQVTGVEMDPQLARVAQSWSGRYENVHAICGDVLSLALSDYTDFYLFNPFDTSVLLKFIDAIESDVKGPVTVVHMSDNGETYFYLGRPGWTQLADGHFSHYVNERGYSVRVYEHPQHYSVWRFDPRLALG